VVVILNMKEISSVKISRYSNDILNTNIPDNIIEESPIQIIIDHGKIQNRIRENLSVTMRTPGDDFNLVAGFLFCEGIIKHATDILSMKHIGNTGNKNYQENILLAELAPHVSFDIEQKKRNFITSAACGFCGKSVADIQYDHFFPADSSLKIPLTVLSQLPALLNSSQSLFTKTGGAHAVAVTDKDGKLVHISEDVGRHNAMDKMAGAMLAKKMLPLQNSIVLFSGRVSYELVQKSIAAGIPVICAIGAPTSLALEVAQDHGITLVCFLKKNSFNIYCGAERIIQS